MNRRLRQFLASVMTAGLLITAVLVAPSAATSSVEPASSSAMHRGFNDPERGTRAFMRKIDNAQYRAARKFAYKRVIRSARNLYQDGFRFTRFKYCEPGQNSLYSCLAYMKRRSDGLGASFYTDVEGTPGYLIATDAYVSFGD